VNRGAVKPSIKNIVFVAGFKLAARKDSESLNTISTGSSGVLDIEVIKFYKIRKLHDLC